jgi:hypothetical protein
MADFASEERPIQIAVKIVSYTNDIFIVRPGQDVNEKGKDYWNQLL